MSLNCDPMAAVRMFPLLKPPLTLPPAHAQGLALICDPQELWVSCGSRDTPLALTGVPQAESLSSLWKVLPAALTVPGSRWGQGRCRAQLAPL